MGHNLSFGCARRGPACLLASLRGRVWSKLPSAFAGGVGSKPSGSGVCRLQAVERGSVFARVVGHTDLSWWHLVTQVGLLRKPAGAGNKGVPDETAVVTWMCTLTGPLDSRSAWGNVCLSNHVSLEADSDGQ